MAYSINTNEFPTISSYADALAHFDKVKPFRNRPGSPIGDRKHTAKVMTKANDGSIVFTLYRTDCVVWHPDNTLTIEGYDTSSTTAFIRYLTPPTIYHGQGPRHAYEPVVMIGRYGDCQVVRAHNVHLRPDGALLNESELSPFSVPTINRKAALAASRRYHLADFEAVVRAALKLNDGVLSPTTVTQPPRDALDAVAELLLDDDLVNALDLIPRGERNKSYRSYHAFGRESVADDAIQPGFMARLRERIYKTEGVIERTEQRVLTGGQYRRYLEMSRRLSR